MRPSEKAKEQEEEVDKTSDNDADPITRVSSRPAMPSWINFGRATAGEPSAQRQRKKSVAEVQEEEDDRHIRFTIGGVGQRMTKEGFIKQMQQLDQSTRREVVDRSSASHTVKTLAKQDVPLPDIVVSRPNRSARASSSTTAGKHRSGKEVDGNDGSDNEDDSSPRSSTSHLEITPSSRRGRTVAGPSDNTDDIPETAVERRRRLAVLQSVGDDDDDDSDDGNDETKETPAERRRREAALGMSSQQAEDSDDDDTPRVPPARRGIRFVDTPDRRQA